MHAETEQYIHSYPHCWRCRSKLIYYARESWFVRTSAIKDRLLALNSEVRWHPAEVGSGRVEGETLKERMEKDPLPLKFAVLVTLEVAEALEMAHKTGIVHRDLKPANVMITPQGHAKVMDFGLAKRVLPGGGTAALSRTLTQASITEHGSIAGTLAYMSPEQAKGEDIDARSDIFSVGIILYEMLSGKHPFSKPSPIETLTSILRDPVPPTHVTPKSVNPVLNPILQKARTQA